MINAQNIPEGGAEIPPNAVSVYGRNADALDDFPVLKAFQQYIDAEQAKAHKRLMSVCVFFTILILTVIGVFMFIIMNISLGSRQNAPVADATIKALSDSNAALQGQVLEQARKMNEQLMNQLAARDGRPAADAELQRQNFELQAKLNAIEIERRLRAEHEAALAKRSAGESAQAAAEGTDADTEKARSLKAAEASQKSREARLKERAAQLEAEEKRLREQEIKMHRRRLYPEFFDEDGNEFSAPVARQARPAVRQPAVAPVVAPVAAPTAAPTAAPVVAPAVKPVAELPDEDDDLDAALSFIDEAAPVAKPVARPAAKRAAQAAEAAVQAKPSREEVPPRRPDANAPAKPSANVVDGWTIPIE